MYTQWNSPHGNSTMARKSNTTSIVNKFVLKHFFAASQKNVIDSHIPLQETEQSVGWTTIRREKERKKIFRWKMTSDCVCAAFSFCYGEKFVYFVIAFSALYIRFWFEYLHMYDHECCDTILSQKPNTRAQFKKKIFFFFYLKFNNIVIIVVLSSQKCALNKRKHSTSFPFGSLTVVMVVVCVYLSCIDK